MFGKRLRKLRKERDFTQADLAKLLNIKHTTVSKYELDERMPDIDTLKLIADIFGVSVDYLIGKESINSIDGFHTPEEAMKFILEQDVIMGFGGFDIDKLSDEELIEFANSLLDHLKLLGLKYKKD